MTSNTPRRSGMAGWLAASFVTSKLTMLGLIGSLLLGLLALVLLPREEEPQIKVPMIDVLVSMPGAGPEEIANRVAIPMEKLLYELPEVEYIYSTSLPGQCVLIARFYVGVDQETAIVSLNQKLQTNFDRIPPGVSRPLVRPHSIDDVPILALTFHSQRYDHFMLRRLAAQVDESIKSIFEVAETKIIGGARRELRVEFDSTALAARGLSPGELATSIRSANRQESSGVVRSTNQSVLLETGSFFQSAVEAGNLVVGVHEGKPVYLREVAQIIDGPEEPVNYVLFGTATSGPDAAVTLSVAKRPGANAVQVVKSVLAKVEALQGTLIPPEIEVSVTRNYGETASEKSNELLLHMGVAVFGVGLLILFFLGRREALIVLLAIPSTLSLTLLIFYLYGYSLNRITLFALIFSIGILVDDAIVVVENIVRHRHLPGNERVPLKQLAVGAVIEVGNPTILATWAVIAAILPMAFVGGLMGPYMRPIPVGSSAAMVFSLIIAFTVTPWAAVHILKNTAPKSGDTPDSADTAGDAAVVAADHSLDKAPDDILTRLYHRIMDPLLAHRVWRLIFFLCITLLLLGSAAMLLFGMVKVKMLPFDNKSEFQIILNMPEGAPLEQTARVAMEMADVLRYEPEVMNYQIYTGTAAPHNFNGLVRHYFQRSEEHMADIQVNLAPKGDRKAQSHDIAKRVRPAMARIAEQYGAAVAVAEVPPGPPVLQTLVAEVYGPDKEARLALAEKVKAIFAATDGVVDIDWYREAERNKEVMLVDTEKAALHGIAEEEIAQVLAMALSGKTIDILHQPRDKEEIPLRLQLAQAERSRVNNLLNLELRSGKDARTLVPLRELVRVEQRPVEQPVYRKNLQPVLYVTADVAGAAESPVYPILQMNKELAKLDAADFGAAPGPVRVYNLKQPLLETEAAIKWDGEWHITLEVFRDLGLAFCVVMVLIYGLMVGWFNSYLTPLVVMAAIPFSLVGILPAHWAMGAFFTATSMIGFMAGAGIVVRNSIILVDFIELRRSHGLPLAEAVVEAGAVRFRPMLLTAMALVVGAAVILADPIFQGLAIALMFGEIASLLISRMAVPVLYFMLKKHEEPH
ncbi:MAG: efflux RND transporter permease subunit [Desulfobulbaceae bacterium]|nr:efflux RND transporter permease subunit [Desulfobulbaceae bacterium]